MIAATLQRFLASLSKRELELLATDWPFWARPDQLPPTQAQGANDWSVWLILGGRGAGKTRTGAEWVRQIALGSERIGQPALGRIALVGETFSDVREVMIDGVSGLMSIHASWERPSFQAGRRRLVWPNGAIAQIFSAEEPEALRGPQFDAAWCDELAKWPQAELAWSNLQFALRLGDKPRQVVTTTPRPMPLLKRIAADPHTAPTRIPTRANAYNLSHRFLDEITRRYGGTRLGRQELDGEFVEERADAFWSRDQLELLRKPELATAQMQRIVIGIDPPAGTGERSCCGIVAAGLLSDGRLVVLADASLSSARPEGWARRAVELYHSLSADSVIVEVNQGGAMVESVLRTIDATLPIRPVHATRGKHARAEPVAALYAQGRVVHAGSFPALEDEMCLFGPDGLPDGRSPDRMDALVWALTALTGQTVSRPRIRDL
jgi:phage terminase large subunit-like protein